MIAEAAAVRHAVVAAAVGSAVTDHLTWLQRLVLACIAPLHRMPVLFLVIVLRVHEGLVVLVFLWLLLVEMMVVDDVLRLLLLQWVPPGASCRIRPGGPPGLRSTIHATFHPRARHLPPWVLEADRSRGSSLLPIRDV